MGVRTAERRRARNGERQTVAGQDDCFAHTRSPCQFGNKDCLQRANIRNAQPDRAPGARSRCAPNEWPKWGSRNAALRQSRTAAMGRSIPSHHVETCNAADPQPRPAPHAGATKPAADIGGLPRNPGGSAGVRAIVVFPPGRERGACVVQGRGNSVSFKSSSRRRLLILSMRAFSVGFPDAM